MDGARPPAAAASRVVVFVPTLDEESYIEQCLASLIDGDPMARSARIVVADGGSRDRTREIVHGLARRWPNLILVDNPGRLQAAALNLALDERWDDAAVLVRCDAHSVYPERFVSRLVETLAARGASSIVAPMDATAGAGCFQRAVAWTSDTRLGAGGAAHRGGVRSGYVDHGHHAAFDLATFRALGGYDPSFRTNEDAEYDHRLAAAGGRIWLEAGIRISYFPRDTPGGLWRQYRRYGAGRARTCLKHRARPRLRQIAPVANLLGLAASVAAAPALGPAALAWPAVYAGVLAAAGGATAVARGSACGLLASLALGIMHVAWGLGFLGEFVRALAKRVGGRRGARGAPQMERSA